MKFINIIWLVVIFFSGCASVSKVSAGGSMVRQIQPDWANECKFLGTREAKAGDGVFAGQNDMKRDARNRMRNIVASNGGNAYVINGQHSGDFGAGVEFEMYKCPVQ